MSPIHRQVLDEIHRHAAEEYPDECCGVVVRDADGRVRAMRVRNIQDEMHAKDPAAYPRTARTAYSGHPADLRAALDTADAPGGALLAFYHSHPDHPSYFSEEDTAQATPFGEPSYPDALQVVVSVYDREVRDVKAFAWSAESEAYVETPLDLVDQTAANAAGADAPGKAGHAAEDQAGKAGHREAQAGNAGHREDQAGKAGHQKERS